MIKLKDSNITDILPEVFTEDPKIKALGYAVQKATQRLISYSQKTSVYATINNAEDATLDMLAAELDTQYYDEAMDISVKRRLVKNTLIWHMTSGTPAAVEDLIATVFGGGKVKEWFEYGGEPFHFRIITDANAEMESIQYFERMIDKVKNVRSKLEIVSFFKNNELQLWFGEGSKETVHAIIGWEE